VSFSLLLLVTGWSASVTDSYKGLDKLGQTEAELAGSEPEEEMLEQAVRQQLVQPPALGQRRQNANQPIFGLRPIGESTIWSKSWPRMRSLCKSAEVLASLHGGTWWLFCEGRRSCYDLEEKCYRCGSVATGEYLCKAEGANKKSDEPPHETAMPGGFSEPSQLQ
jgi:hypothetical protein